jgi:hypothetical protein
MQVAPSSYHEACPAARSKRQNPPRSRRILPEQPN